MGSIDLHTHSTMSDGDLSPTELVRRAADEGVSVLALTDHDTVAGVAAAAEAGGAAGVRVLSGLELSTVFPGPDGRDGHADVLGYLVDTADAGLSALLARIRETRRDRARRMVRRLQELGAAIEPDALPDADDGSVGRPHVARALVAAGFVDDVQSAFDLYIGRGRSAYVERYRLSPADACRAVRAAGGVPVLAHPVPGGVGWRDPLALRTFLPGLVDSGLGGLECYYPRYTARTVRWLEALAHHFGLVPTGGSDYHGPWRDDRRLGGTDVPADVPARLLAAAAGGGRP